jgi:hypothetical protein
MTLKTMVGTSDRLRPTQRLLEEMEFAKLCFAKVSF